MRNLQLKLIRKMVPSYYHGCYLVSTEETHIPAILKLGSVPQLL